MVGRWNFLSKRSLFRGHVSFHGGYLNPPEFSIKVHPKLSIRGLRTATTRCMKHVFFQGKCSNHLNSLWNDGPCEGDFRYSGPNRFTFNLVLSNHYRSTGNESLIVFKLLWRSTVKLFLEIIGILSPAWCQHSLEQIDSERNRSWKKFCTSWYWEYPILRISNFDNRFVCNGWCRTFFSNTSPKYCQNVQYLGLGISENSNSCVIKTLQTLRRKWRKSWW